MRNLQPWIVRQGAVPAVSYYLWRLMASHRQTAPVAPDRVLQQMIVPIDEHFERKLNAMALYGSQFGEFFSSREDCIASLTIYAKSTGAKEVALERYWAEAIAK